ncbi:MAG: glycosyltransferase family 4 protein [Candidatus Hydrogenedentales bacterium]
MPFAPRMHDPVDNNRPLKILLTDPHLNGGGQVTYVGNLARQLTHWGHQVTIGCRQGSVLVDAARQAGCAVVDAFPFRGGIRPRAWAGDLRLIRRFVEINRPDILHVNLSQDHWSGAVANELMGHSTCLVRTRHNTYPVRDTFANRLLNRRWTDYQIAVCDVVRRELAAQRTFLADRLCSIQNGIDAERYQPNAAARESARGEFGYGAEDVVVGIAARLVKDKGHEYLFRAVAQLADTMPNLRVLVLGQGPLRDDLERLTHDLGISDRIIWAGFRNDMSRCVQAFDIGVQPSIGCDTSSLSLKEEMAAEVPVIASDYGGLVEIVTDGVEGIVVPTATVEPLAAAIQKLAGDPSLRQRMGGAGRARVLREFTLEIFARRTLDAYRRALEFHRVRANGSL